MDFGDVVLGLILLLVAVVVTVDLGIDPIRRKAIAVDHRAWWNELGDTAFVGIQARAAAGFCGSTADGGADVGVLRLAVCGLALPALVGATCLGAGALRYGPAVESVLPRAFDYFAAPGVGIAAASTILGSRLLGRIARSRSLPGQLLLALGLAAMAALSWVVLMHSGLWLEWLEKTTPTAFGSEWFYAEAYMEYVREPAGLLVPVSAALMVALPGLFYAIRVGAFLGCKTLRPVLAPACDWVLTGFAGTEKGPFAASAIVVAILAGLARWTLGGS